MDKTLLTQARTQNGVIIEMIENLKKELFTAKSKNINPLLATLDADATYHWNVALDTDIALIKKANEGIRGEYEAYKNKTL